MKPNLEVQIGSLKLKNPVMVASGTFGTGEEFKDYVDVSELGAVVTKTITQLPREGNRPPRVYETTGGMLNAIGLQNDGLEDFIRRKLPKYRDLKTALIVSVGGESDEEYVQIVRALSGYKEISAFELNISCPNVTYQDKIFAYDEQMTFRLVKEVRQATSLPLIVKLSPNVCDIASIAKAAEDAGADAVSLVNTILAMAVNVHSRRSVLGNVTGGLSGPAIKPVALRMVWQVHNKIGLPLVGMGGIMNAYDALEFIIAGATAVAVGSANFVDPKSSVDVIAGIEAYCLEHNIADIKELIGSLDVS